MLRARGLHPHQPGPTLSSLVSLLNSERVSDAGALTHEDAVAGEAGCCDLLSHTHIHVHKHTQGQGGRLPG